MNRVFNGAQRISSQTRRAFSTLNETEKVKSRKWLAAIVSGGVIVGSLVGMGTALCSDVLSPTEYPWNHNGLYSAYDTASLRRGYEVYRNVCATCHSLEYIHFRDLIGVTHTEEQAKALALSYTYVDGPNEKGEQFERKGRLADVFKSPYRNEEHARYVKNGAYPPDLTCVVKGRVGGPDYLFSVLTGYRPAPHGVSLREGLHYNPYFPGGAISMAKALFDGVVEYEDGTPATESQMAKDVTTFLAWCSEPEADTRKKFGVRALAALGVAIVGAAYFKRFAWNLVKTRKISYVKDVQTAVHTNTPKGGNGGH